MSTLAGNLDKRRSAVHQCDPAATVYWIGDASHQAGQSDHNPDARGVVHAIDVMYPVGPKATAVVDWCLADPADLEYVIHNRTIWTRDTGWRARPYTLSDPHTNHVHISGKHGSVGRNAATGTGYDPAAEAMTPAGRPCDMEGTVDVNIVSISPEAAQAIADKMIPALFGSNVDRHGVTLGLMVEKVTDNLPGIVESLDAIETNTTPSAPSSGA